MIATTQPSRHSRVDYQALAEFRHEIRRFLRVSEQAARGAGIEPQHHQLLLAIKGSPPDTPPTIAFLAEQLQLRHHSVVGLVDRLEQRGLIRRRRDPEDQRRAQVSLTDAGEQILHGLSLFHQDEIRSRAQGLVAAMMAVVRASRARK